MLAIGILYNSRYSGHCNVRFGSKAVIASFTRALNVHGFSVLRFYAGDV
jgi:hypothetical protein